MRGWLMGLAALLWLGVAGAAKPLAPMALSWEVADASGGVLRLLLEATGAEAIPEVAVEVRLPAKVRRLDGPLAWRGPVRAGRQRLLSLTVDVSAAPGGVVVARARWQADGTRFAAQARQPLPARAGGVRAPRAAHEPPRLRREGGQAVWEYQVRP